jgi:hypothetical protein
VPDPQIGFFFRRFYRVIGKEASTPFPDRIIAFPRSRRRGRKR